MLPVGHHLFIAGALSAAIPPEGWLSPLDCFPPGNHQSRSVMIPYGNIRALAPFPSVLLALNRRLHNDYSLAGKEFSVFRCQFSEESEFLEFSELSDGYFHRGKEMRERRGANILDQIGEGKRFFTTFVD